MTKCIVYKKGYKYQLQRTYVLATPLRPERDVGNDFVQLTAAGRLTLQEGYAWDGASGPAPDVPSIMRASLVHDALYQLMREDHLDEADFRQEADELLRDLCVEDGMNKLLAKAVYEAVRVVGGKFADPADDHPPSTAPKGCDV